MIRVRTWNWKVCIALILIFLPLLAGCVDKQKEKEEKEIPNPIIVHVKNNTNQLQECKFAVYGDLDGVFWIFAEEVNYVGDEFTWIVLWEALTEGEQEYIVKVSWVDPETGFHAIEDTVYPIKGETVNVEWTMES